MLPDATFVSLTWSVHETENATRELHSCDNGWRIGDILRQFPRGGLEMDCQDAHLLPDHLARARNAVNLGATLQTVEAGWKSRLHCRDIESATSSAG